MMHKYAETAEAFFGELARSSNDELRERFVAMLRELVMKCAVEGCADFGPSGLDRWMAGRISICNELMADVEGALARERGKANPEEQDGLSFAPV